VYRLVRDAPRGAFPGHAHPEGEEILVLGGAFPTSTETTWAGSSLMYPYGSRHSPRSEPGCTPFVRLRQSPGANLPRLVEDTNDPDGWRAGLVEGLGVRPLYAQGGDPENVALASGYALSAAHRLGRRGDPAARGRVRR